MRAMSVSFPGPLAFSPTFDTQNRPGVTVLARGTTPRNPPAGLRPGSPVTGPGPLLARGTTPGNGLQAAYVRSSRSTASPCGPLAVSPDCSGASRWAATRQKSPAGPLIADSAVPGPNSQDVTPSGAVRSHRTSGAPWPARANA